VVAQLAVQGGSLELEPNRQGPVLGVQRRQGQAPPRLALRVRLVDPAQRSRVKPLHLKLRVDVASSVALHRSAINPGREQPCCRPNRPLCAGQG